MKIENSVSEKNSFILQLDDEEMQMMRKKVDNVIKNIASAADVPDDIFTSFVDIKPDMVLSFKRDLINRDEDAINLAIRGIISTNLRLTLFADKPVLNPERG